MDRKQVRGKAKVLTARQKKQVFRDKKYKVSSLGNKQEGQGFAEQRKQKAVYNYRKLLRKEEARSKYDQGKPRSLIQDADQLPGPLTKAEKKLNTLQKAEESYKKKKAEKLQIQKETAARKKKQEEAVAKYQANKKKKYNLLCKKNFRGQPKVAGQMAILLDRIQASQQEG